MRERVRECGSVRVCIHGERVSMERERDERERERERDETERERERESLWFLLLSL